MRLCFYCDNPFTPETPKQESCNTCGVKLVQDVFRVAEEQAKTPEEAEALVYAKFEEILDEKKRRRG